MRNALIDFVRNNYQGIEGIEQTHELLVRDEGQKTVKVVFVRNITDLIERGIISADYMCNLMVSGVY